VARIAVDGTTELVGVAVVDERGVADDQAALAIAAAIVVDRSGRCGNGIAAEGDAVHDRAADAGISVVVHCPCQSSIVVAEDNVRHDRTADALVALVVHRPAQIAGMVAFESDTTQYGTAI